MTRRLALHPLAERFRRRLRAAARELPRDQRAALLDELDAHLEEAAGPSATDLEARGALERLGTPEAIVAAARPDGAVPRGAPVLEVAALLLLSLGSLVVPFLGWLVGAVLLLVSSRWTRLDKLLGLLVWPGGLGIVLVVGASRFSASEFHCSQSGLQPAHCAASGPPVAVTGLVAVILLGAPLLVLARLAGRLRRG